MRTLAAALIAIGLALLDKDLDKRIEALPVGPERKALLRQLEDALIDVLKEALRRATPRILRSLGKAIPNDPTTGSWAG